MALTTAVKNRIDAYLSSFMIDAIVDQAKERGLNPKDEYVFEPDTDDTIPDGRFTPVKRSWTKIRTPVDPPCNMRMVSLWADGDKLFYILAIARDNGGVPWMKLYYPTSVGLARNKEEVGDGDGWAIY